VLLAVGEHYLGQLDQREIRMATGFSGGIGGSYQNNCGAFSAGVMIIGALYGRTSADQDDQTCRDLAARYLECFRECFDTINCGALRDERYGSGGAEPCSVLVERASWTLMEVLGDPAPRSQV